LKILAAKRLQENSQMRSFWLSGSRVARVEDAASKARCGSTAQTRRLLIQKLRIWLFSDSRFTASNPKLPITNFYTPTLFPAPFFP